MAIVNGVVVGLVKEVDLGLAKVNFPWLDPNHLTDWIRVSSVMSGGGAGAFFMPNVDDEVLVAFEQGDTRFPFIVGFLWNGQDKPPSGDVRDRKLMSKNGHQVRFLDSTPVAGSKGALVIEDAHGNRISMSKNKIVIQGTQIIEIEAPQIWLQGQEISPKSDGPPQKSYKRRVLANTNAI